MGTNRKIKIIVNGNSYMVEVGDLSVSPTTVIVNGQPYQVGIEAGGSDATSNEASPSSESQLSGDGVSGESAVIAVGAVTAPMPGNITSIAVSAGQHVNKDQELCTLEAMKMQNAIRSPRAGVIASVDVVSGQAVSHGDSLITFE